MPVSHGRAGSPLTMFLWLVVVLGAPRSRGPLHPVSGLQVWCVAASGSNVHSPTQEEPPAVSDSPIWVCLPRPCTHLHGLKAGGRQRGRPYPRPLEIALWASARELKLAESRLSRALSNVTPKNVSEERLGRAPGQC